MLNLNVVLVQLRKTDTVVGFHRMEVNVQSIKVVELSQSLEVA